jgi:hypothetical protein
MNASIKHATGASSLNILFISYSSPAIHSPAFDHNRGAMELEVPDEELA